MIEARNIQLVRGGKRLLDGVSLSLSGGELLAVVGPNGAGKTSLLRILSGELRPDAGGVSVDGMFLDLWSPRRLARRRAVLPQDVPVDFPLSALEVVLMGRMPHGHGCADREIALHALSRADAAHLANRLYPTLSGGERQRVQLARVLTQLVHTERSSPGFLLLDEPTSALDLSHQFSLMHVVREEVSSGAGGLAILHDLNLAAQFADRILVLEGGRVAAVGTPAQVLEPEMIRRVYAVDSVVAPHPCLPVPHVIALPPARIVAASA